MRTDWSKRTDPVAYQNYDETGSNARPAVDAVRFLVDDRDVAGFGSETIGTDAGQAYHLNPPIRAITTCTARAVTASSAWRTWTSCRRRAP